MAGLLWNSDGERPDLGRPFSAASLSSFPDPATGSLSEKLVVLSENLLPACSIPGQLTSGA